MPPFRTDAAKMSPPLPGSSIARVLASATLICGWLGIDIWCAYKGGLRRRVA